MLVVGFLRDGREPNYRWFIYFFFFLISAIISRLFFFFFKFYTRICMSGDISFKGEAMPVYIKDLTGGLFFCYLSMELYVVISVGKYGNHYFKWALSFSLNILNSIVHTHHFFNCINYLLHTTMHTVQLVWGKLIIAVCFKSVLHPGLTTLSHFLTEMKELA